MRLPNDRILAQEVPEIDLILGGHDHFVATETVNNTLIAKSGEDFQHVTVIKFDLSSKKFHAEVVPITRNFPEDQEMAEIVKHYQGVMQTKLSKVIAYSHVELDATVENVRTREANIGNVTKNNF
jgi:2',3'-cyclic-nucleotide 2'-phosphodiesterase (5'-nucleotidase family)